MPRGGAREGAGRKKKDNAKRTTLSFVCSEEEKKIIDRWTKASGLSRSQFIMACIYHFKNELEN